MEKTSGSGTSSGENKTLERVKYIKIENDFEHI